jgi:hypothetical protein
MAAEREFIEVFETSSALRAEWVAGALRNEGIEAHVGDDLGAGGDPGQVTRGIEGGGVHVRVARADAERARAIVAGLGEPPRSDAED